MAKLKTVLNKKAYEALSDEQKTLYTESDDGEQYVLDADDVDAHPAVKGLRNALQRLKGEGSEMRKRLAVLPEDMTPEQIAEILAEHGRTVEEKAKAAGKFDELKAQLLDQNAKALAKERVRIEARDKFLKKVMLENEALRELNEAGVDKRGTRLLLPHILSNLEPVVNEDNGEFSMSVSVIGPDRKARLSPSGKGEAMTIKDLITEMRESEDFALAFPASAARGSGAQVSTGSGPGAVRALSDLKTPADKAAFISKHGLEAFNALLPTEAPASGVLFAGGGVPKV